MSRTVVERLVALASGGNATSGAAASKFVDDADGSVCTQQWVRILTAIPCGQDQEDDGMDECEDGEQAMNMDEPPPKPEPQVDEDGFTMVTSKKNRKGRGL